MDVRVFGARVFLAWTGTVTLLFLGTGLLAYVVIPLLLGIWDRVLDYMSGY